MTHPAFPSPEAATEYLADFAQSREFPFRITSAYSHESARNILHAWRHLRASTPMQSAQRYRVDAICAYALGLHAHALFADWLAMSVSSRNPSPLVPIVREAYARYIVRDSDTRLRAITGMDTGLVARFPEPDRFISLEELPVAASHPHAFPSDEEMDNAIGKAATASRRHLPTARTLQLPDIAQAASISDLQLLIAAATSMAPYRNPGAVAVITTSLGLLTTAVSALIVTLQQERDEKKDQWFDFAYSVARGDAEARLQTLTRNLGIPCPFVPRFLHSCHQPPLEAMPWVHQPDCSPDLG